MTSVVSDFLTSDSTSSVLSSVSSVAAIAVAGNALFGKKPDLPEAPILPSPLPALSVNNGVIDTTPSQVESAAASQSRDLRRRQALATRGLTSNPNTTLLGA